MISCVLLAAGLSQRFGSPKALASLHGTTVIEHLQTSLVKSDISELIVVLGAHKNEIKSHLLNHKKVLSVYNKDYNLGQTSSFQAGLQAVSKKAQGIMLLPVDVPFIRTDTFDFVLKEFEEKRPRILIPTYQNQKGHPPIFHRDLKSSLLAIDMSVGLNTFQHEHQSDVYLCEVNAPGIIKSFNTKEEFKEFKDSDLRNNF